VFGEVLKGILAEGYHDRIDPFVNVLSQYVQIPVREKREHFESEEARQERAARHQERAPRPDPNMKPKGPQDR